MAHRSPESLDRVAGEITTRKVGQRHRDHKWKFAAEVLLSFERHARPVTIGLNCSFGAAQLRPHLASLSAMADTLVMAYPNAGLPNELGEYDEAAEQTAEQVRDWAENKLVNIVGGCCGTTPAHIAAIAGAVRDCTPRTVPAPPSGTLLAGLEPMLIAACTEPQQSPSP